MIAYNIWKLRLEQHFRPPALRQPKEELKREIMNLTITDRVKDHAIKQDEKDRSQFAQERKEYIDQLMTFNRRIGTLETQLLQLGAPGDAGTDEAAAKK